MLADRVMERLSKRWRGPALGVRMKGKSYQLGEGEARTEVRVHRPAVLRGLTFSPSLTFGEAYMRGDIEVQGALMDVLHGTYQTMPESKGGRAARALDWCRTLTDAAARRRAVANAQYHYDLGNDFYRLWLDPSLTYSCACFLRETDDLQTAQQQKIELVCRKAHLQPGQHLLDIGCGWARCCFMRPGTTASTPPASPRPANRPTTSNAKRCASA